MPFSSLFLRGLPVTSALPTRRRKEANTSTHATDYLTRSVRRASGFVQVGYARKCQLVSNSRETGFWEVSDRRRRLWLMLCRGSLLTSFYYR